MHEKQVEWPEYENKKGKIGGLTYPREVNQYFRVINEWLFEKTGAKINNLDEVSALVVALMDTKNYVNYEKFHAMASKQLTNAAALPPTPDAMKDPSRVKPTKAAFFIHHDEPLPVVDPKEDTPHKP